MIYTIPENRYTEIINSVNEYNSYNGQKVTLIKHESNIIEFTGKTGNKYYIKYVDVEIKGTIPIINGYKLVGEINLKDNKEFTDIKVYPGYTKYTLLKYVDLTLYTGIAYVIHNIKKNEYKFIQGSLNKFFNIDVSAQLEYCRFIGHLLHLVTTNSPDDNTTKDQEDLLYSIEDIVYLAVALYPNGDDILSRVNYILLSEEDTDIVIGADKDIANKSLDILDSLKYHSTYKKFYLEMEEFEYIVDYVVEFLNNDVYFGEIGKIYKFILKLDHHGYFVSEKDFSTKFFSSLSRDGIDFVMFTDYPLFDKHDIGKTVKFMAKVIKHGKYKGKNQNTLEFREML